MLAGGDVMILGFLRGLIASGDVRLDRADQLRLIRVGGWRKFGIDLAGKLINIPGLILDDRRRGGARTVLAHADGSLARSIIRSSARTGTRNSRPILIVGISPRAAAS